MKPPVRATRWAWRWAAVVFALVLTADFVLVALAGTDVPFYDQWDVTGGWLLPAWSSGTLSAGDLFRPHNEHRIVWTHLLDLGLFAADGQWDPLLELMAGGVLRAVVAGALTGWIVSGLGARARAFAASAIVLAFVPLAAWHNALWGFQSQVLFAIGFGLLALRLLTLDHASTRSACGGVAAGAAAAIAMAPGALVPAALAGAWLVRGISAGEWRRRELVPVLVLGTVTAALFSPAMAGSHALAAVSWRQFAGALGRALAWPHTAQPLAAVAMNLPMLGAVGARLLRRRRPVAGEDFVTAVGWWALLIGVAAAWRRGGGDEWIFGVPSRYADFLVLLVLANAWFAAVLARDSSDRWLHRARLAALAWGAFALIGWIGLSAEMVRRVIVPRTRDRAAPERLVRRYQQTRGPAVFAGQPRLLVPHPNLASVAAVLDDPRMRGRLPPSLQPERPVGALSRAARVLLGRQ